MGISWKCLRLSSRRWIIHTVHFFRIRILSIFTITVAYNHIFLVVFSTVILDLSRPQRHFLTEKLYVSQTDLVMSSCTLVTELDMNTVHAKIAYLQDGSGVLVRVVIQCSHLICSLVKCLQETHKAFTKIEYTINFPHSVCEYWL